MDIAQIVTQSSKDSFDYVDSLQLNPASPKSVINRKIVTHNVSKKYLQRLEYQKCNSFPSLSTEKGNQEVFLKTNNTNVFFNKLIA